MSLIKIDFTDVNWQLDMLSLQNAIQDIKTGGWFYIADQIEKIIVWGDNQFYRLVSKDFNVGALPQIVNSGNIKLLSEGDMWTRTIKWCGIKSPQYYFDEANQMKFSEV